MKEKRVLIVDDESSIREFLQIFLLKFGLISAIAENGKKALDILKNDWEGFDLIITDVDMPEIDGIEMARRLNGSRIPIIFISGREASLKEAESGNLSSFVGGFLKPINFKNFIELIKKTLA